MRASTPPRTARSNVTNVQRVSKDWCNTLKSFVFLSHMMEVEQLIQDIVAGEINMMIYSSVRG